MHRVGGLCVSDFGYDQERFNGLQERAYSLISDVATVANNLGFRSHQTSHDFEWVSNKGNSFTYRDPRSLETSDLMQVKAFKNGNLHIKLNQDFLCRLNVEFGRLKGWIKSPKQGADELGIELGVSEEAFNQNLQIGHDQLLLITTNSSK